MQQAPGGLRDAKIGKQFACPIQCCDRNSRVTRPAIPLEPAPPIFDKGEPTVRRLATMQSADDIAEDDRGLVVSTLEDQLRQGIPGLSAFQQQGGTRAALEDPDRALPLEMLQRSARRCVVTLVTRQFQHDPFRAPPGESDHPR